MGKMDIVNSIPDEVDVAGFEARLEACSESLCRSFWIPPRHVEEIRTRPGERHPSDDEDLGGHLGGHPRAVG